MIHVLEIMDIFAEYSYDITDRKYCKKEVIDENDFMEIAQKIVDKINSNPR